MRLHYRARESETMQYADGVSLFPYICKYFLFPVGHADIHVGDAVKVKEACSRTDGLIKCSVLLPEKL